MIFSPFTPIPFEYHVILSKSNQTVFDAPLRFVYRGSTLLVVPSSPLLLSCAKLMVVSPLSTSFEGFSICVELGWHERFFYVQDSIITAKYPQLLSEQNKLDLKSFKDKLPLNIEENPMFQRLGRYLTSVRVFPDPILFLAEMAFRNFICTEDDEDLSFLPKEPSSGFGTGSPSVSINTEPLKANGEPVIQPVEATTDSKESLKPELFVVHPGSIAARIKVRKCKIRGGSSRPPVKRKLAPGSSTSCATRAKTSSLKDDASFLTVFDDDKGLPNVLELKMLLPTTSRSLLLLLQLRRIIWITTWMEAIVDNAVNRRSREQLQAAMTEFEKNPAVVALREKIYVLSTKVKEHKLNLDGMMFESQKWVGYQPNLLTLESKVTFLRPKRQDWRLLKCPSARRLRSLNWKRREVVSKVVPYVAMELVHSDDMGSLVSRIVSSAILYGRCMAYEQVADMKEPFDLSKVKGYRSSYKKDHTQASNDFATVTFPWLDEFVADPSAPIEVLLSKNPPSLQRHAPSRTQVPFPTFQRATPSSAPVSNPMSPPPDTFVAKPQSSPLQ
nr:hypothetical protein [Tanacetum cinerariifolium]